jgi:hypothetical protein
MKALERAENAVAMVNRCRSQFVSVPLEALVLHLVDTVAMLAQEVEAGARPAPAPEPAPAPAPVLVPAPAPAPVGPTDAEIAAALQPAPGA